MKDRQTYRALIIIGIIVLLLIGGSVWSALSRRVPENDLSTVGNTSGNLNNSGYFAERDGRVYFANSYDKGALYSMNPDGSDMKKLISSSCKNICVGGNFLYYYMDTSGGGDGLGYVVKTFGIYRSTLEGRQTKCLDREAAVLMQLVGNYIYYQRYNNTDFTKFYKIKTDKSDQTLVSDSVINPCAADNGIIYFNGQEKDHYLYALDTRNDTAYTVYEGNLWYPQYANGYIYYMDVSSDYRLCRYNLSTHTVEILTNDRADMFNVGEFQIYYQRSAASGSSAALMRMNLDGSNPEIVAEGVFNSINLTSEYVYFREFGNDITTYMTPLLGSINVTEFTAARQAALANAK